IPKRFRQTTNRSSTYLVECKMYATKRKVSVDVLRNLYGVVSAKNATGGLVVTSSTFTNPATQFADRVGPRMSLIDALRIRHLIQKARVSRGPLT
ncbi:MAG: restriction endonuclease, partial [Pseudomonadales bacterium]